MKLAEARYDNTETGCCARLDRARWDGQVWQWTNKPFLKDHVYALLHIPLNMGAVMRRDQAAIEAAAAWPEDPLWLSDEVSPWGSELYCAVETPVPDTETVYLNGRFRSQVFEGPYREVGRWMSELTQQVEAGGERVSRILAWYTTCPNCAKVFGRNDVVLFAQVEPAA